MIDIWQEYFEWLNDIVTTGRYRPRNYNYHQLLWQLHNTEFVPILKNDINRIGDATDLRRRFGDMMNEYPVGIFEIMVALASRAEITIMRDESKGDRTARWFWTMVNSLGLTDATDDWYDPIEVADILDRFIHRKYARNGAGGLFTVRPPHGDLRRIEIWDQLCLYLDDVLADEGLIDSRRKDN